MEMETGVYEIVNLVNDKRYVGSASRNLEERWMDHRKTLRGGRHGNRHLQHAWDKYGEQAFQFVVIERVPPEECVEREQHWMDYHEARNGIYNICPVAGSNLGLKLTDESKERISRAKKGSRYPLRQKPTVLSKLKAFQRMTGRRQTEEVKEKIGKAFRGKVLTAEHCEKISNAKKMRAAAIGETTRKVFAAKRDQLIGRTFGGLTILGWTVDDSGKIWASCKCECGNEVSRKFHNVTSGAATSCGCRKSNPSEETRAKISARNVAAWERRRKWAGGGYRKPEVGQ